MKRLFKSLLNSHKSLARRKNFLRRTKKALSLESLESRSLMAGIPALNSNPGATAQLYIDFDGHFEPTWGSYSNVTVPAFDQDSNPSDFNSEETAYIEDVFRIVAEDYAPFNINVTTVEPPVLAAGQPISAANGIALRVTVGGTSQQVLGASNGGLGYYNSFTGSVANLAVTFPVSSSGSVSSSLWTGSVVSHEAGHSFGLRHQLGASDHGAKWSGIMNLASYGYDDNWWSQGKDDLGNVQDDLAMLSNTLNGFGYRVDDVGNTVATAANLIGSGTAFSGSGVIATNSDVDVWRFNTDGIESLKVRVDGALKSQNLDAVLHFLDSSGNILFSANPTDSYDAELTIQSAGVAYVAVQSTGAYSRLGQYTITVEESTPGIAVEPKSRLYTGESGASDQLSVSLTYRPTSNVTISVASSDLSEGTPSTSQLTFTPDNWFLPQIVTVTGVDDLTVDGPKGYQLLLGPAVSSDPLYDGLSTNAIEVISADNDVPGKAIQIGGLGYAYIVDMVTAADGSVYVTGSYDKVADFDPGSGDTTLPDGPYTNSFIAKYSQSFELMWVKRVGGEDGNTSTRGIAVDNSGNLYVTGHSSESTLGIGSTTLPSIGSTDSFLAKLSSNGDVLWAKNWGSASGIGAFASDVFVDSSGVVHVGGGYYETVDFNPGAATLSRTSAGGADIAVSRFDANGNFLSVTTAGSVGSETINLIQGDSSGGIYATGSFSGTTQLGSSSFTSNGSSDAFLLKVNSSGAISWARQIAGAGTSSTSYRLASTNSGEVYLAGSFSETIQFDANTVLTSAGSTDGFVSKWSTDGSLLLAGQLAGVEATTISDIKVDSFGRPVVMGAFGGSVNMQPFSGEALQTALGVQSDFILQLNVGGGLLAFHQMPRDVGVPRVLALDSRGNILATGNVNKSMPMPTGEVLRNNNGGIDSYLLRLNTAPGVRVSPTSGLTTSENGGTANFSVVLDTAPTADVTISLASSDLTEGTLSHSSLTFTPANWQIPQVVTITGVNDALLDNDQTYNVVFGASASSDPAYNGLQPTTISVVNRDDEISVATFTKTDGRAIPDRGTLNSDLAVTTPGTLMDVNVRVSIQHGWNSDLDVTLIAPDGTRIELFTDVGGSTSNFTNTVLDQSATTAITAGAAPFTGVYRPEGNLSLLNGKSLAGNWRLEVKDDERLITGNLVDWSLTTTYSVPIIPAGVTVTPTSGLVTSENGTSASFTIVLTSAPDANTTISIASNDSTEGTASTSNLIFTPTNWNIPQTVTITGIDDTIVDGAISYSINLAATSTDPRYNGLPISSVSLVNQDNDVLPTKFYTVDDGSTNRTFEYAANGTSIENYTLNTGNAAPRGAASNLAGDKVWVIDANKTVYVYNNSGALLGSWSAGSLASNATVEGIATNGIDIWLIDAQQDRVYRYTGAASRLSGTQTAASNFALNSSNTSPKDIVTDGTSIWVVNDSSTDTVFKYNLSGSLLGSWTISTANSAPTGLTIDPSGASQSIWIVDSGTDRVYEYTNSRSRTSGSQSAALFFALAAGNTNPQGIADPPPAASGVPADTNVQHSATANFASDEDLIDSLAKNSLSRQAETSTNSRTITSDALFASSQSALFNADGDTSTLSQSNGKGKAAIKKLRQI